MRPFPGVSTHLWSWLGGCLRVKVMQLPVEAQAYEKVFEENLIFTLKHILTFWLRMQNLPLKKEYKRQCQRKWSIFFITRGTWVGRVEKHWIRCVLRCPPAL